MELGEALGPWVVMTKTCMSFLPTANGSLSKCPRVPCWRRKPLLCKQKATVCPFLRVFWRLDILDLVPHSQPQVPVAVGYRVEVLHADLVGLGAFCGRGGSWRLRSCDVIVRSGCVWPWGRYRSRLRRAVGIRVEAWHADLVGLGAFCGRGGSHCR